MKRINRFPHYLQFDVMDCGPTCLRMIAKYYGKTFSIETLRARSFITREGVSMLGIGDAAESIGFRTSGVRVSLKFVSFFIFGGILAYYHWTILVIFLIGNTFYVA